MRVLIAEDIKSLGQSYQKGLEGLGCEVVLTSDGREAIAHLESETFDAAVIDVMMPHVDGVAVLRFIRQTLHSSMPVLLLVDYPGTTWPLPDDLAVGTSVATKPLSEEVFAGFITSAGKH